MIQIKALYTMIQIKALYTMNICRFKSTLSVIRWSYTGTNRISHNYKYPGVTSFRRCKEQYYTRMLCQKKLNICINKILIYNRKWVRPLSSSQTRSKHRNYQATMCVLCSQWRHLFLVGRIRQGEIKTFTKSLYVSYKRLKKQYFIENSLKTSKTQAFSTLKDVDNEVTLFHVKCLL